MPYTADEVHLRDGTLSVIVGGTILLFFWVGPASHVLSRVMSLSRHVVMDNIIIVVTGNCDDEHGRKE